MSLPDRARARQAIAALLEAVGAPVGTDPELHETSARAADMYLDELLDGYTTRPEDVLRDGVTARDPGLVVLTGVRYVSVCPHHLLPSRGRAHIAYLPSTRVVGLGTIVRLLEVYAHRLILQETLGQSVAEALVEHLGAIGAGVMLRARHQCLSLRGERQGGASVVTSAFAGSMAQAASPDRALFVKSVAPVPARARRGVR